MAFTVVQYTKGSYIVVEGQKSTKECCYLIKEGSVSTKIDFGRSSITEVLNPGDFFNLVPVLSGHMCDETTMAVTDVVLIAVSISNLPILIKSNTAIALKILKKLSKTLRLLDKLISQKHIEGNTGHLYNIGLFYHQQRQDKLAYYALKTYIKLNPNGGKVKEAKILLEELSNIGNELDRSEEKNSDIIKRCDNEFIFCEYELGYEFYCIIKGKIKISKIINNQETIIAILYAGDIFGEMAIIENAPRNASAISSGDTELLVIRKSNFTNFINNNTDSVVKLMKMFSDRIWVAHRQIVNLSLKEGEWRMADMLLTLAEKVYVEIKPQQKYIFDFSINDLVRMVGLSQESASSAIAELLKEKIILQDGGKVVVPDMNLLARRVLYSRNKNAKRISKEMKEIV